MDTAVAFMIFNRPSPTARVLAEIAKARPPRLLVVADGPRAGHPNDVESTAAARALIERVDWPCHVSTNYADTNMGCARRIASGLEWVFSEEEEAIILEDDCLPDESFFPYCEELLGRYREEEKIMHISGDNFQHGMRRSRFSYYLSKYPHIWGWATWRRAWRHYATALTTWLASDSDQEELLREACPDRLERRYWCARFHGVAAGRIDTWDFTWMLACWLHGGLTILPGTNLVSNIGFGEGATHTMNQEPPLAGLATRAIVFPLRHPPVLRRNRSADKFTFETVFCPPVSFSRRLLAALVNRFHRWRDAEGA